MGAVAVVVVIMGVVIGGAAGISHAAASTPVGQKTIRGMATIRAKLGHLTERDQSFRPLFPFRIKNGTSLLKNSE